MLFCVQKFSRMDLDIRVRIFVLILGSQPGTWVNSLVFLVFSVFSELQKLESETQILGFCGSKNHNDFSESAPLSNSTPFFSKDRFFLQRPAWRWAYFSAAKKTHAFLKLLAALERDSLFL